MINVCLTSHAEVPLHLTPKLPCFSCRNCPPAPCGQNSHHPPALLLPLQIPCMHHAAAFPTAASTSGLLLCPSPCSPDTVSVWDFSASLREGGTSSGGRAGERPSLLRGVLKPEGQHHHRCQNAVTVIAADRCAPSPHSLMRIHFSPFLYSQFFRT